MAKKTVADAAKAKAAKQKKIVIALACVLALAVAYAAKTMMSLNGGAGQKPQAVSSAAATPSSTPVDTTPSSEAPAPPTLAGSEPTTSYPTDSSGETAPTASEPTQLIAAVQPPADSGQLESFSRFETKDPFDSLGPKQAGSSSSGTGSSGSSGGTSTTPAAPPAPPSPPPTSAVISVNGVQESVATGADFPASALSPLFELVSLTATTAQVAIAGGSYSSGQATLTLHVNKAVTLVNTADGTRYTLLLLPQGTTAPGSSSSSSSSTPSSSDVPTTTATTSTTPTTTTP